MAGLRRNYASGPQTRRFTEPAGLLSLSRLHIYTCTHRFCEGCPLSLSAVKQTLKFSQEAIGLTQLGGHLETAPPEQWGQWGQIQENTKSTHTALLRLCLSLPPRLGNRKGKMLKPELPHLSQSWHLSANTLKGHPSSGALASFLAKNVFFSKHPVWGPC